MKIKIHSTFSIFIRRVDNEINSEKIRTERLRHVEDNAFCNELRRNHSVPITIRACTVIVIKSHVTRFNLLTTPERRLALV